MNQNEIEKIKKSLKLQAGVFKPNESNLPRIRGFEVVKHNMMKSYDETEDVIMPKRGSKKSAGYDFFAPCDFTVEPNDYYFLFTDIKAYMLDFEVLEMYPRSSTGAKKNVRLKNTVGIIDCDYYENPKNDGNIGFFLHNFGHTPIHFKKGDGLCQGIFKQFLPSDNCNTDVIREGGVGSTGNIS